MALQECQAKTSSREFNEWKIFLDRHEMEPTKNEFYLAQIAYEVHRTSVSKPNRVKFRDFLIRFVKKSSALSPKDRAERSKNFWLGVVGMKRKGKKRGD